MARINLLPWRQELRKQRQREFGAMLVGGLVVAGLIGLYVHFFMESMIENQVKRNRYLDQEIVELNRKIVEIENLEKQKAALLARMDIIQKLQASRPQIVHLFDEVARTVPDGIYLVDLNQKGAKVTLKGRSQSNARVSAYMRNIDASDWVTKPNLKFIQTGKKKDAVGYNDFELVMKQKVKKPPVKGK